MVVLTVFALLYCAVRKWLIPPWSTALSMLMLIVSAGSTWVEGYLYRHLISDNTIVILLPDTSSFGTANGESLLERKRFYDEILGSLRNIVRTSNTVAVLPVSRPSEAEYQQIYSKAYSDNRLLSRLFGEAALGLWPFNTVIVFTLQPRRTCGETRVNMDVWAYTWTLGDPPFWARGKLRRSSQWTGYDWQFTLSNQERHLSSLIFGLESLSFLQKTHGNRIDDKNFILVMDELLQLFLLYERYNGSNLLVEEIKYALSSTEISSKRITIDAIKKHHQSEILSRFKDKRCLTEQEQEINRFSAEF